MQKHPMLIRVISFLLCFLSIWSFGICGSYASSEQVLLANNLDFMAYVKRDMQTEVINSTYKSYVNGRPDYVRFFIPKDVWLDNIQSENQHNLTKITLSTSGYFDIQVDKEYNLTTTYDYSCNLTTNVKLYVSVWYSGSNSAGIYKTIDLYSSSYAISSNWRENHQIDINFKLDSSKFPEGGYKCKFYLDFEQSYGNLYLSSDQYFGVTDIHLTNLDDNSGWFQKIIDAITSIPSKISSFFTNLGSTIGNFFSDLWEKLRTQFENIGKWFSELGNKIGNFFTDLWNKLQTQFENIGKWFKELGDKIGAYFEKLYNDIIEGIKRLFIPEDGFFEKKKTELETFLADHFGILWTAPDIIISTIKQLLTISPQEPTITMPAIQFEWEGKLVTLTEPMTVHFNDYIGSGTPLHTLYQFYRTFVTIFLIFLFLQYCVNKYHYIFGKDGEAVAE